MSDQDPITCSHTVSYEHFKLAIRHPALAPCMFNRGLIAMSGPLLLLQHNETDLKLAHRKQPQSGYRGKSSRLQRGQA